MNRNDVAVSTNTLIPELRHRAVCRRRLVAAIIEVSVFLVYSSMVSTLTATTNNYPNIRSGVRWSSVGRSSPGSYQ